MTSYTIPLRPSEPQRTAAAAIPCHGALKTASFSVSPTIRCHCFAAVVATLSMPSQRILSAPVLNRRFKTSAQPIQARKDGVMQNGSLSREQRKRSSDVWCYRWWESGPTGRRIHRRIILGTVEQLHDKRAASQATVGLRREINLQDRGDCQSTAKSYKTIRIVGWIVGWKIPGPQPGALPGPYGMTASYTTSLATPLPFSSCSGA
jgi:hypothetical protein